jgi:hypothetical protein
MSSAVTPATTEFSICIPNDVLAQVDELAD